MARRLIKRTEFTEEYLVDEDDELQCQEVIDASAPALVDTSPQATCPVPSATDLPPDPDSEGQSVEAEAHTPAPDAELAIEADDQQCRACVVTDDGIVCGPVVEEQDSTSADEVAR